MRPFVDRLEGVDLSAGMIAEARRKGLYDVLAVKSIADRLAEEGKPFDLIFAADVFSYIGDLEPIFEAIARQLAPGGVAAFTVEKAEERETFPFALRASRRFSHHGTYLETLAARNRFYLLSIEEADLRQDRGVPIEGLIALIEKP
jgi:predicted TPR repeat methyltransferase